MVRYNCENDGPRPESYFEDYELVQMHTSNENEKKRLYWELKTGAETGWDYSSRYFFLLINIFKKLFEFICNLGSNFRSNETNLEHTLMLMCLFRWFVKNETNVGNLEDTKGRSIIPVDLNCFYALNAKILSDYYKDLFNDRGISQ